jgi:hypothetical protein
MGDRLADRGLEVGEVDWLGQEVERATVHGRADIRHVTISGDNHGRKLCRLVLQLGEKREPSMRGMLMSETTMSKSPLSASKANASTSSRANPNTIEPSLIWRRNFWRTRSSKIGLVINDEDFRGHTVAPAPGTRGGMISGPPLGP